jgi:hypothetical protein
MIENLVLVRTYSAGVHVGVLQSQAGTVVKLTDAQRIWRWRGANTLNELAMKGASDDFTRISERVPEITLTEAIEIIPVSPDAQANLLRSRWG